MLEPAMFLGLGVIALWVYIRYPRLRPRSILLTAVHVVASFAVFALLPTALGLLLSALPRPAVQPYVVLSLLILTLTYVLLSWVWLIARILHDLGGRPRGGHPAATES